MGVGPYTITSARETVVDFSAPYMEDGGGILTRKDDSSADIMAGLESFSTVVWLSLVATTLAVSVAFYCVVRFSPYSRVSQAERRSRYWHLCSCVMHISGSFMMQGRFLEAEGFGGLGNPYSRVSEAEKRSRYWHLRSCVMHISVHDAG